MWNRVTIRATMFALLLAVGGLGTGWSLAADADWSALNAAREWLTQHSPDGTNAVNRRRRMAVLQKACDQLPGEEYRVYSRSWITNATRADRMEVEFSALRYLRVATTNAMADIRRTTVTKGVAIWFLYNMGYVFKTPTACFGIDIKARDSEKLVADLDFLLISHEHEDHYHAPLIEAMLERQKPVITRWFPGTTILAQGTSLDFGETHVNVNIGDHHYTRPGQTNNMLMFEVDCGPAAHHTVIYHSGDGNNLHKMRPVKPIDVFIPHVAVGLSIPDAIRKLKPKLTLVSHVMELGHNIGRWRWSYEYAFNVIKGIPEKDATILTWGERYLLPGTVLQDGADQEKRTAEPAVPRDHT